MRLPRLFRPVGAVTPPTVIPAPPLKIYDPHHLETLVPELADVNERIAMGTRCRDADAVPKVARAGTIETLPDGRRVQVMHDGSLVLADGYCGPWMTRLIGLCRGHHEPQEERMFHEVVSHLPPGGTMIELGGYWAYYSIWFLRAAAGRRALLLEPDPGHMSVGKTNLALNGLDATFVHSLVGGAPGTAAVFQTEASGQIEVPYTDVLSLMSMHGIDHLSILHCDTQGAEFAVIEQSAALLQTGRIDWVFVSTHHHSISGDPLTHQRCLELLRSLGGHIEAEHSVQESFSGDGLICARFCEAPAGWKPVEISHNRSSRSLFRDPLFDLAIAKQPNDP